MASSSRQDSPDTLVIIDTLASELRATEASLAQWRAHAGNLHAQLRSLRRAPGEEGSLGAPRVLAGAGALLRSAHDVAPLAGRPREFSTSSTQSTMSLASLRSAPPRLNHRLPPPPPTPGALPNFLTREFGDPKEAMATQRREKAATELQRKLRGLLQRRKYRSLQAFFAIVNGTVELRASGKSVPAYTLTVVRGGRCWQVSHRFSDWVELDRQLAKTLPDGCDRPALPARYPFRTARIVAYRQFALNSYLQLLLPLVHPDVHARRILLNFLSRSHLHWQYADDFLASPRSDVPTGGEGASSSNAPWAIGGLRHGVGAQSASLPPSSLPHGDVPSVTDGSSGRTAVSSLVPGNTRHDVTLPNTSHAPRDLRALG